MMKIILTLCTVMLFFFSSCGQADEGGSTLINSDVPVPSVPAQLPSKADEASTPLKPLPEIEREPFLYFSPNEAMACGTANIYQCRTNIYYEYSYSAVSSFFIPEIIRELEPTLYIGSGKHTATSNQIHLIIEGKKSYSVRLCSDINGKEVSACYINNKKNLFICETVSSFYPLHNKDSAEAFGTELVYTERILLVDLDEMVSIVLLAEYSSEGTLSSYSLTKQNLQSGGAERHLLYSSDKSEKASYSAPENAFVYMCSLLEEYDIEGRLYGKNEGSDLLPVAAWEIALLDDKINTLGGYGYEITGSIKIRTNL